MRRLTPPQVEGNDSRDLKLLGSLFDIAVMYT